MGRRIRSERQAPIMIAQLKKPSLIALADDADGAALRILIDEEGEL